MSTSCYACYSLNDEEREHSSSGGVYPLLARQVINNGGVVFAACYDENLNVVHRKLSSLSDIPDSQGSKYVSSLLGDTFRAVAESTDNPVLFIGTPCQCAGLISFLEQRQINRANITIVDFVCHGVPSRTAWNAYKTSMKSTGKELTSVNMRDKSSGWSKGNYSWREITKSGREIITPRREVPYMKGMLANIYLRPTCYDCCFKGVVRDTDFTLGDYWGVWNHDPDMDDDQGTSLLFVHTEKGNEVLESIREQIKIKPINPDDAVAGNGCIVRSTKKSEKRTEFYRRLDAREDFIKIIEDMTRESFMTRSKRMIKRISQKLGGGGISNTYIIAPMYEVAA